MNTCQQRAMDKIYGVELKSIEEIPFRHFGYFPVEEPMVDLATAQERYIRELTKDVKRGSYVLDLGCAFGKTSIWLAQNLDCQVLGIDVVETQIQQATKFAEQLNLNHLLKFECVDASKMEFPEATFDYIIALGVLLHIPEKEKVLANAYKALKPDGKIAFSDPIIAKDCPWLTKKFATWLTFEVSFIKMVEEYCSMLKKAGFKDIEKLDVTETSFIKTFDLSKEEQYKTLLAPFQSIWANRFVLDLARNLTRPALMKRHWGWYFFWGTKK